MNTSLNPIEYLPFRPLPGLSSPHMQTILASFSKTKTIPPSTPLLITLEDGDQLCCEVSQPSSWKETQKTVIMVHGLGGSHASNYMVRISFKLYEAGYRVIRANLRSCGSGQGLARLPYNGGASHDVLSIIQNLKKQTPHSPIVLVGFSLGGNIVLKLAGELGEAASHLLHQTIAICPPVDLSQAIKSLSHSSNRLYHRYYLNQLRQQGKRWIGNLSINSLYDFDNLITAPQGGFMNASDYYAKCSSRFYLSRIQHPCQILFAADDPFIHYQSALEIPLSASTQIKISPQGGHMGFLSWTGLKHRYFWLDQILLKWIESCPKMLAS